MAYRFVCAAYWLQCSRHLTTTCLQGTALLYSGNGGRSWTTRGMVTGFAQQTACIIQLAQGIAIVFSHKDYANTTNGSTKGSLQHYGQRAIISYDEAKTFSNAILELHHGGM